MFLRKFVLSFFIFLTVSQLYAQIPEQEEPQKPLFSDKKIRPAWMQKLRYGGSVALQFWGQLYIDVSPMIGYELSNSGNTSIGISPTVNYIGTFKMGNSAYGGRVFLRQHLFRRIFAHAELETINAISTQFYQGGTTNRMWGTTPYVGLGLNQGSNPKRGAFVMILANPLYPNQGYISPYQIGGGQSPFTIRVGFY